jgi:hypothetical protein
LLFPFSVVRAFGFLLDPTARAGKRRSVFSAARGVKKEPPTPKAEKPEAEKKTKKDKMDAPSQNMNALSVQSLFFVNDEAMHEIDLKVLAKLPETLRLLQEQVQSLTTSSSAVVSPKPVQDVEPRAEVTEESAPSFTRRARQQQPAVVA